MPGRGQVAESNRSEKPAANRSRDPTTKPLPALTQADEQLGDDALLLRFTHPGENRQRDRRVFGRAGVGKLLGL